MLWDLRTDLIETVDNYRGSGAVPGLWLDVQHGGGTVALQQLPEELWGHAQRCAHQRLHAHGVSMGQRDVSALSHKHMEICECHSSALNLVILDNSGQCWLHHAACLELAGEAPLDACT